MASPVIRTTYALDADTVARLDCLAKEWKLSRSAALRKLIREREREREREPEPKHAPSPRLAALRKLQQIGKRKKRSETEAWLHEIRAMRKASTRHMLQRSEEARRG